MCFSGYSSAYRICYCLVLRSCVPVLTRTAGVRKTHTRINILYMYIYTGNCAYKIHITHCIIAITLVSGRWGKKGLREQPLNHKPFVGLPWMVPSARKKGVNVWDVLAGPLKDGDEKFLSHRWYRIHTNIYKARLQNAPNRWWLDLKLRFEVRANRYSPFFFHRIHDFCLFCWFRRRNTVLGATRNFRIEKGLRQHGGKQQSKRFGLSARYQTDKWLIYFIKCGSTILLRPMGTFHSVFMWRRWRWTNAVCGMICTSLHCNRERLSEPVNKK